MLLKLQSSPVTGGECLVGYMLDLFQHRLAMGSCRHQLLAVDALRSGCRAAANSLELAIAAGHLATFGAFIAVKPGYYFSTCRAPCMRSTQFLNEPGSRPGSKTR